MNLVFDSRHPTVVACVVTSYLFPSSYLSQLLGYSTDERLPISIGICRLPKRFERYRERYDEFCEELRQNIQIYHLCSKSCFGIDKEDTLIGYIFRSGEKHALASTPSVAEVDWFLANDCLTLESDYGDLSVLIRTLDYASVVPGLYGFVIPALNNWQDIVLAKPTENGLKVFKNTLDKVDRFSRKRKSLDLTVLNHAFNLHPELLSLALLDSSCLDGYYNSIFLPEKYVKGYSLDVTIRKLFGEEIDPKAHLSLPLKDYLLYCARTYAEIYYQICERQGR